MFRFMPAFADMVCLEFSVSGLLFQVGIDIVFQVVHHTI